MARAFVPTKTMAALVVAIALLATAPAAASTMDLTAEDLASEQSLWALYERWLVHYKVARDLGEKARRFNAFKENVRHIYEFNLGDAPYELGLNDFSDMTDDEFRDSYGGCLNTTQGLMVDGGSSFTHSAVDESDLPRSVDWRMPPYGGVSPPFVTDVKDQGKGCGSYWAFAAIAAVEGIKAIKTKVLMSLSDQQLVDCDTANGRCRPGFLAMAFDYIAKNGGVASESAYPYTGSQSFCRKAMSPFVTIDGYAQVPTYDETALRKAVAAQPVVVRVDSHGSDFKNYKGSVFVGPCGTNVDHAMTLVGYGEEDNGAAYWILKNSWGSNWGESGYMRLKRDVSDKEGLCGILTYPASYPIKNYHPHA